MPTNKNAQLHYQILDCCFSDFLHQYTIDDLLYRVNESLFEHILSRTEILPPSFICTESYIVSNVQNDEKSFRNVNSYIKTKIVRFWMSLVTSSQAINKQSFAHVPLQDFSKSWIDEEFY